MLQKVIALTRISCSATDLLQSFHHNPMLPTFIFPCFPSFPCFSLSHVFSHCTFSFFFSFFFFFLFFSLSIFSFLFWTVLHPFSHHNLHNFQQNSLHQVLIFFSVSVSSLCKTMFKYFNIHGVINAKEIILPALILTCQYSATQEIGVFNEDFTSPFSLFHKCQCP